jgi:hypothetical protein
MVVEAVEQAVPDTPRRRAEVLRSIAVDVLDTARQVDDTCTALYRLLARRRRLFEQLTKAGIAVPAAASSKRAVRGLAAHGLGELIDLGHVPVRDRECFLVGDRAAVGHLIRGNG